MESPFAEMVGTMVYPSPDEARQIREILSINTGDLARLDVAISHAQIVLELLSVERAKKRRCVDIHSSLLSPIRKLAPELLAEIFLHTLQEDPLTPEAKTAPLLLLKVCRVWRIIALETPQLWASLSIDHATGKHVQSIANWLSRSGSCPLSLCTTGQSHPAIPIVELMGRYVHRWQHVTIHLPEGYDRNLNLDTPSPSLAPHLKSIELVCSGRTVLPAIAQQIWTVLASAPNLREISCDINPFPPDLRFSWANLQKLSLLVDMSVAHCFQLLEQCPNVVECGFSSLKMTSEVRETYCLILLPRLRSLMVATDQNLKTFFDHLCMPALEELALESFSSSFAGFPEWSQSAFLDMLCRSSCPLSRLQFYFMKLSSENLIACLQATEGSLVELTIHSAFGLPMYVNDIVLRLLTHRNDAEFRCLCPKLEVLSLLSCITCLNGTLADMVESRWRVDSSTTFPITRLRMVELRDFRPREDVLRLKKLVKEGLVVTFD
jgi:hypothetical protein